MKSISVWAQHNKWWSRIIIVCSYLILNILGYITGKLMADSQFFLTTFFTYSICTLFFLLLFFYPSKHYRVKYKNYYNRQKSFDVLLVAASFILVVCYSNKQVVFPSPFHFSTVSAVEPSKINIQEKPAAVDKKNKSFSKEMKQKLKKMYQKLKHEYKSASNGEKTVAIILAVIVAIALMMLVGAISCNLACSGSDGAAILVLLLGVGTIIFFLIKIIKRINRGKPLPKAEPTENTSA